MGAGGRSRADSTTRSDQLESKVSVPAEVVPHVLIDDLFPDFRRKGVLIPLKTTMELRQDHTIIEAYITRAPTKAANNVIGQV